MNIINYNIAMAAPSTNNKINITNYQIEDMRPTSTDPEVIKLLPKKLFVKRCSFVINGVNNAVSNAIRRVILDELLVGRLYFEIEDFHTNDSFLIPEMIQRRVRLIPILQTVKDATLSINYTNTQKQLIDCKSSLIKGINPIWNDNITLFTLNSDKYIKIDNIKIKYDYGYNFAGHSLACNATSVPHTVVPYNAYTGDGVSVSINDSKDWKITFNTNGSAEPKAILSSTCQNIIERIYNVSNLQNIQSNLNDYIITLPNESSTIGNLYMREILELYPNIPFVTYQSPEVSRTILIKIKTHEKIEEIISLASESLVNKFKRIQYLFESINEK